MSQLQESCHSPRMRHLGAFIVSGIGYPLSPNKRTLAGLQLQLPRCSSEGDLLERELARMTQPHLGRALLEAELL